MPGVPSNKACERCKKKHLKCDETRPHCQRCATAGVECPGYVQTRKFIDQGATVRRRYAPYQESHAKPGTAIDSSKETEKAPSSRANAEIDEDDAFHSQLAQTTLNSSNESHMDDVISSEPFMAATQMQFPILPPSGDQPLGQINPLADFQGSSGPVRSPVHSPISPNAAMAFHPSLESIGPRDRSEYHPITSGEGGSPQSDREEFQHIFSELMTGTEHELAFLARHYAEVIGPWLDLSDTENFFSVYVPIRAINSPVLKYAVAALAAKQLGRVKGGKSSTRNGMYTNPASTEIYPNATRVDWFLKAANYYYLAASDLNNSNSNGYTALSTSAVLESPIETINRWLSTQSRRDINSATIDGYTLRKAEDMLAAVVLLTFYRLLDSNGEDWQVHLSGIRVLFNQLLQKIQTGTAQFTHAIRASFWNFARQDHLGSYLTRTSTHLDPTNLALWRAAGISIDDQMKFHIVKDGSLALSQDDQAANGLSWLICKVINFLAQSKQSQIAQWTGSPQENMSQSPSTSNEAGNPPCPDTNTWLDLCFDIQTWFEGVPETFRPCVRIERPRTFTEAPEGTQSPFPEVFYSQATCAFAMQHYHFGRIALLLNRPADMVSAPSTAFDRLQGYREVTKEVEYRSRELCGIALGRPRGEVRIHMVPLLFAVGQCLESVEEHRVIIDLLRGLEADWGWATEYAIQKLQASWSR
ncbi:hypothetical protein N7492_009647 [Penicillium capsulatum]|uniref:Zn(2)-C6 fungal-type domain-containing protein n=1 Tax=Penicillium capsulatum TaxID=69766 RepID=A0A9W9HXJ0_9EURO|nr:hypothetical protein N7492_009647 [Penicillium capsulatum]KAJ6107033.1 hypothetical protein N7512_010550 [Penicillium capsulatum]